MVWVMTLIHAGYAGDFLNHNTSIRNYKDASIQTTKTKPSGYRKTFYSLGCQRQVYPVM